MDLIGRRKKRAAARVLTATTADLDRIGELTFGGTSTHPPGLDGVSVAELDGYVMSAIEASGMLPGSPGWPDLEERFLSELTVAAEDGGDRAVVGAFCIAANLVVRDRATPNARYLDLTDRVLLAIRNDGVAFMVLPEFALRRWEEQIHERTQHGFPEHWPSWREDLTLPPLGDEPPLAEPLEAEPRLLTQLTAAPDSNLVYAERRGEAGIAPVLDGASVDGKRRRWDWCVFPSDDYIAFLRELAERYVTATAVHWANDDFEAVLSLPSPIT